MMPIDPASHVPAPKPADTPRPMAVVYRIFFIFLVSGGVAGAVTSVVIAGVGLGLAMGYRAIGRQDVFWEFELDTQSAEVLVGLLAFGGGLAGLGCGLSLWIFASLWPALRHPIRAASLCASLGGSVRLMMMVFGDSSFGGVTRSGERMLYEFGAVLVAGAVFGFLAASLVAIIEPRFMRSIRN